MLQATYVFALAFFDDEADFDGDTSLDDSKAAGWLLVSLNAICFVLFVAFDLVELVMVLEVALDRCEEHVCAASGFWTLPWSGTFDAAAPRVIALPSNMFTS